MKNPVNAGKGTLEQARAHIEAAQWNLIHAPNADFTTPEYEVTFKLMDLLDEIKELENARASGENPCNSMFAGEDRHPVEPCAAAQMI